MEGLDKNRKGMVLRIERSSIHDGDGMRTVVFLKGCPLRCQWCSTPESQSFDVEQAADKTYGTLMTVEEVMKEIRKDSLFYFHSGGGMTLSGGELLAQPEFSLALLKNSLYEGINTTIETCFYAKREIIEKILPYVNTAFVDLKLYDREKHKQYCGVDNDLILGNLLATNELAGAFRIIIRTPIIPGINDDEEELCRIGEFCSKIRHLAYVQLLPYHKLGTATYRKLGRPYALEGVETPTMEHMERCRQIVGRYVRNVF